MLRTVKSLPSLRVLSSTKYNLAIPEIPYHQTRFVHQTSKKNASPLLNSKNSEFTLMSLQTLKTECRKRGLKVSGRKADLVSRITQYESSFSKSENMNMTTMSRPVTATPLKTNSSKMNFSKTTDKKAKGDDSHIDFIKPVDMQPPKLVRDDYIVQIPSLSTEASKNAVTKLEKKLNRETNPNDVIISKAPGSESKIFEHGSLDKVEDQNQKAFGVEIGEEEYPEEPYKYDSSEIPKRDKGLFAGFLGATALWWLIKPKEKKEKNQVVQVK